MSDLYKGFVETRSFDELLDLTVPDPKYESVVNDVIRDKISGWRHRYYEGAGTCWDVTIARTANLIHDCEVTIKDFEKILTKQNDKIANSRHPPNHKDYKALHKKEKDEMDKMYVIATDSIHESKTTLSIQKPILDDLLWLQYVEKYARTSMNYLINRYKANDNYDYLRKGVTCIWSYVAKLQEMSMNMPKKQQEREQSNSAW